MRQEDVSGGGRLYVSSISWRVTVESKCLSIQVILTGHGHKEGLSSLMFIGFPYGALSPHVYATFKMDMGDTQMYNTHDKEHIHK